MRKFTRNFLTVVQVIFARLRFVAIFIIAQARIEREKRLAELEALAGVDIETLAAPTTQPTTKPIEVH